MNDETENKSMSIQA